MRAYAARMPRLLASIRCRAALLRRVVGGALLGLVAACASEAPSTSPTPSVDVRLVATRRYLTDLLDLMQANSINRLRIDWPGLRARVLALGAESRSVEEAIPAIREAIRGLGDGHSFFQSAAGTIVVVPLRSCTGPDVPVPATPSSVGYIRVPGFSGPQPQAFAEQLQRVIREQDEATPRDQWIVDLRGNSGGNMWPMIAGLGPILGDAMLGSFVDPQGGITRWEHRGGQSLLDGRVITQVSAPVSLRRPAPRVAVLIDTRVASSGEATAIAFKGRPNTRFFGSPTCGLSTANGTYTLSDGARLFLTVSTMADRTGRLYGDQVPPDEVLGPEAVVARALAWVQSGQ